ncbi:MAG: hypothetical protein COA52_20255 [Hyphomicrobiales bacterium]|nr:MAG: hypothetical protein COA52_20255 [Hyphomicrobiales bacterium]
MQNVSDKPDQTESEPQFFSQFVKDSALKILIDYQRDTGRMWQKIRTEIINVTGAEATVHAPIITRQDLESWSKRKNILGDEKFKWVFRFLTHPDTLARPGFSKAHDLMDFGLIKRMGGAFQDFFDDHAMSGYIRRIPLSEDIDAETVERRMNGFEGCFTGSDKTQDYCLSLERFRQTNFFICHFFSWPINGFGEIFDWDIDRFSGFCTIGNQIRLHTKAVMVSTVRDMYVVPKIDHSTDQVDTLNLILHSLTYQAIENVVFDKFEAAHKRLKYIDPTAHTLLLERTTDSQLTEFIDQFRWNLVL